jgi:hypothetical protein
VVCPGLTATERVQHGLTAEIIERETRQTPTGRLSTPTAALYLGSAANGNIQVLTVAGSR